MAEEKTKEVVELQVPTTLRNLIEALVFAAKEPLMFRQMKDIYEGDGPQAYLRQLDEEEVEGAINELNAEYQAADKPYRIVKIAGGYQFATLSAYADWIGRLYKEQGRRKLSQSGIESLAIIAYKQPVTKADIESIRGVNCDYVLKTLLEKELVTVVGRAHAPGRPLLYGTTREFLKHFGLNEITDLPRPREIEEILGESQFETERRMLEAQAGAEKMKEEEPDFKSRLPHIPKKKPDLDKEVEIKPKSGQYELKTVRRAEDTTESAETQPDAGPEPKQEQVLPLVSSDRPDVSEPEIVTPDVEEPSGVPILPSDSVGSQALSSDVQNLPVLEHAGSDVVDKGDIVEAPAPSIEPESILSHVAEPTSPAPPYVTPTVDVAPPQQEETETTARSAVNKTRWQSWKEKVQGFIKKIFG